MACGLTSCRARATIISRLAMMQTIRVMTPMAEA
jgi:hypothetical protein